MKSSTPYLDKSELWPSRLPNSFLNRARQTIQSLGEIWFPCCDCGEDNPLKNMIDPKIVSIDVDFNREGIPGKWETILCFEVLEHLYNPLFFLENLRKALNRNGVIYLSTPRQWPQFLRAKHHFHEIPLNWLLALFDEAGLAPCHRGNVTIAGNWYNHIYGLRPVLRYFQHTRLFELVIK